VSVDAKKKELLGQYRNGGREWRPQGQPEEVKVYDFVDEALGQVIPYGVYELTTNRGWVSVGIGHDPAEFAVESLRRWWQHRGSKPYPQAKELLITAEGGGSKGSRCRLWEVELPRWADETGLRFSVSPFPLGTRQWNKIEHRMFCPIPENGRGRPLVSREVVVNLIGHITTKAGLEIRAALDENRYPTLSAVRHSALIWLIRSRACLELTQWGKPPALPGDSQGFDLCPMLRSRKIRRVIPHDTAWDALPSPL
jgi:hypothetical protein